MAGLGIKAVRAECFSFAYPHEDTCIGPLDWCVERGTFQLLIGATGSGKTTLLRNLKKPLTPVGERTGKLEVLGYPVDDLDSGQEALQVGYVAQNPENQLVCDSVWHELAFGLENLGTDKEAMRRRVAEVAHFFGIEPLVHRDVASLSGGQKQMVTLASVLAMRPQLLLFDEPTAQLDPVAARNFAHALFRINRELSITVVVATHAPEELAAYATDAVRIADGALHPVSLESLRTRPLDVAAVRRAERCASDYDETVGKGHTADSKPVVRLRDAYLRYGREDDWVLRGCDLQVAPGSVHALVGGNGCGKSTALRIIAGLLKPERGRALNALKDNQAYLPQSPKSLFVCDTVAEELCEWQRSAGYDDAAIDEMLERFGLAKLRSRHPYDLSGGQQQLLALAKLFLTEPDLLLLDEPTKGLDAAFEFEVARAVRERADCGMTIVLATHDLAFAALVCDRVSMLFDGQATCTEHAADFFEGNLFYRPSENVFTQLWENSR